LNYAAKGKCPRLAQNNVTLDLTFDNEGSEGRESEENGNDNTSVKQSFFKTSASVVGRAEIIAKSATQSRG